MLVILYLYWLIVQTPSGLLSIIPAISSVESVTKILLGLIFVALMIWLVSYAPAKIAFIISCSVLFLRTGICGVVF